MPGGELSAMFEGLSADAEEAAGNISESLATLGEKTAENEESSLSNSLENEAKTAKTFTDIREGTDVETGTEPSSVPAAEEAPGEPASGAGEGEPPASGGAPASTAEPATVQIWRDDRMPKTEYAKKAAAVQRPRDE